jgi:tagaturonate reductase
MRVVPLLLRHYRHATRPPLRMARGFAAFLLMLKVARDASGKFVGEMNGKAYTVQDDDAALIASLWERHSPDTMAAAALSQQAYWGSDLTALPGFEEEVSKQLLLLLGHPGQEHPSAFQHTVLMNTYNRII